MTKDDQINAALEYMKRIEADPENGPATSGMPLLAEDYAARGEEIERLKRENGELRAAIPQPATCIVLGCDSPVRSSEPFDRYCVAHGS